MCFGSSPPWSALQLGHYAHLLEPWHHTALVQKCVQETPNTNISCGLAGYIDGACCGSAHVSSSSSLLAPQSGALRISAYRDFQPNPIRPTYSFQAFKPIYGD